METWDNKALRECPNQCLDSRQKCLFGLVHASNRVKPTGDFPARTYGRRKEVTDRGARRKTQDNRFPGLMLDGGGGGAETQTGPGGRVVLVSMAVRQADYKEAAGQSWSGRG